MSDDQVPELKLAAQIDFAIRRDSVLNPDELAARGPRVLRDITLVELILDPDPGLPWEAVPSPDEYREVPS